MSATTRTFSLAACREFSRLSGDGNPLHVDPVRARRLLFGGVVVHGVYALLWALDATLAAARRPVHLTHVEARFLRPIALDESVTCRIETRDPGVLHLALVTPGRLCASACVEWEPFSAAIEGRALPAVGRVACVERALDDLVGLTGSLPLALDGDLAHALLPDLAATLHPPQLAALLALSRLSGMECPGLHSVTLSFDLRFARPGIRADRFDYAVTSVRRATGRVALALRGPLFRGRLISGFRPAPVAQPSLDALASEVAPREFAPQRAVVVGGSRGLGEIAAKFVAAGGGEVRVGFATGAYDATRVCEEILASGGRAEPFRLDAAQLDDDPFCDLPADWDPTHLLYCATPHIEADDGGDFDARLFRRYCDVYVTGFEHVLRSLRARAKGRLGVLFPSTLALDGESGSRVEYAAAKAAGEALCRRLDRAHSDLDVVVRRLPRTRTDQTASFLPKPLADPAPLVLDALRAVARAGPGAPP